MSGQRDCRECGAPIPAREPGRPGRPRLYCSTRCASQARSAKLRRARLALLEEILSAPCRVTLSEDPRRDLARAVFDVGRAEGREATRLALLRVRDIAHAWASDLGVVVETEPSRERAA